ncbi:hypothetical protein Zmor_011126 [Zophobas morio]|uniref:Uncharacterized protein n=1 Tax=Zophobas morio TaxID=2755281 RepID=A0AA38MKP0_9CUCU|nr:hypothetical protein Zmor_011126 [Zophobas morio]
MLIGNLGIGLFLLITNNIAWISLSIAGTFTIILLFIPLGTPVQISEIQSNLDKDHIYIYQVTLLALLILTAVLGFIFFFVLHCIEPVRSKTVKLFYM